MSDAAFRVVPLDPEHARSDFNCGSEPLNRYFRQQVTQDVRRNFTTCFVALGFVASGRGQRIAGFYTLAAASVLLSELPAATGKKLPRYPTVPVVRLGRLAVDLCFAGRGLGGALLADAIERSIRSDIAAFAMVVDAKDESVLAFYRHHGFSPLPDSLRVLFLPLGRLHAKKL